jgi:hypothetical protein
VGQTKPNVLIINAILVIDADAHLNAGEPAAHHRRPAKLCAAGKLKGSLKIIGSWK